MRGVTAHLAEPADGRLAGAHGADRLAMTFLAAQIHHRAEAFPPAWDKVERRLSRDQLAALIVVGVGQQRRDRDFDKFRIAVEFFAVGKGELGAFDLQMNEVRASGIEAIELKSPEQSELLQHHRALAPDAGLAYGIAP